MLAILEDQREATPEIYGNALERVSRRIAKARKLPLSSLHVYYVASGCGFWIARLLGRLGVRLPGRLLSNESPGWQETPRGRVSSLPPSPDQ